MALDRAAALARIGSAPVARLATIRPEGGPHIVPVTFAIVGEQAFTMIDHKPKATAYLQRIANIEQDPRTSLLVDGYDDDWTALWWVRLDGSAKVVTSGSSWETARDALTDKYHQYRESPPRGAAIVVEAIDVRWWEAAP